MPDPLGRLRSFLDVLLGRHRFEESMADEMRHHIAAHADDLMKTGLARDEALRRARMAFGSIDTAQEESRAARGLAVVDAIRQDSLFAARQMLRAPGVTIAVLLSLALGIGANTAIFGVVDAVMLRTLRVGEPERLYFLAHGARASTSSNYPLLERYRALDVFEGVTAYERWEFNVRTRDGIDRVNGQFVSGNYHGLLGVPMILGLGLASEVDRARGSSMIAVISDDYWARAFGRDPDVIGRIITVNGQPLAIAGVTAPGFHGLMSGYEADLTLPLSVRAMRSPDFFDDREGWRSLTIVARLREHVSEQQALSTTDATFRRFWSEPENAWARGDNDEPRSAVLLAAARGSDSLRRQFSVPLMVLMGGVGLVLIIACANVVNLLLARAAARGREVAVRMSIGASRGRLMRQFLTEALLLSCAGGALGLLVAQGGSRFITMILATGRSPVVLDVELNAVVLLFTLVVSVLTGIAFGVLPAVRGTRVDLTSSLKDGGATIGASRPHLVLLKSLVSAQFALCALVICTAGLLTRTLINLRALDSGFSSQGMLLFNVEPPADFEHSRRLAFYDDVRARLSAVSGVSAVAYGARSPLDFSENRRPLDVAGMPSVARLEGGVSETIVGPDYFDLFGLRIQRGRLFSVADRIGTEPVAVINETLARRVFGEAEPLGHTVLLGADRHRLTIVGVVEDARESRLQEAALPAIYTAMAQSPVDSDGGGGVPRRATVVLRTAGDPLALSSSMRRVVGQVADDAVVTWIRTMAQQVDASIARERMLARVSGAFSLLALLLAAVGLYGTLAYLVARRTREIGLRLALGATQASTRWSMVGETLTPAVIGITIGLTAALAAGQVIDSFLFGLSPRDPATMAVVAAILLAIALVSGYWPARRAAKVDPMLALRAE
jgi:predicted permease